MDQDFLDIQYVILCVFPVVRESVPKSRPSALCDGQSPTDWGEGLPKFLSALGSTMVFIIDGCSFYVAHVLCKKGLFPKKIGFDDSFDLTKCLQQIEMPDLLHLCAY